MFTQKSEAQNELIPRKVCICGEYTIYVSQSIYLQHRVCSCWDLETHEHQRPVWCDWAVRIFVSINHKLACSKILTFCCYCLLVPEHWEFSARSHSSSRTCLWQKKCFLWKQNHYSFTLSRLQFCRHSVECRQRVLQYWVRSHHAGVGLQLTWVTLPLPVVFDAGPSEKI